MAEESEVVRILRDLIRFDTSNPPGNEKPAAEYIAALLRQEGFEPVVIEPRPGRANVVARLKGSGAKPPLLLSAHLDVVAAQEPGWKHPPFAAEVHDGCVWGRGAVDMKHMAAMSLATLLELKRKAVPLARDVIFAGVADEEAGGHFGAGYLIDNHKDLIEAQYCLTELGGMSVPMGKGCVIPVQTAEKGHAWLTLRARGASGHGSMPKDGGAIAALARAVHRLSTKPLGYHLTETANDFFSALAETQGPIAAAALKGLLNKRTAPFALRFFPAERREVFRAMLYNTVSVTQLSAGVKVNVIPDSAEAQADGRYLPGVSQEKFLAEIRSLAGRDIEVEVTEGGPPIEMPAPTPLMETIVRVMARRLPEAEVVPYLIPGMTDAKHYARAGITTYGFAPVKLEPGEPFSSLYHAPNERVSIAGLEAGASWLYDVVSEFCGEAAI